MAVNQDELRRLGRQLLLAIGEDPDREGLRDTPDRWARWWAEFCDHDPGTIDRVFQVGHADEMVAVTGIQVWSLCEHHLLPFSCTVTVGYLPDQHVVGLSKVARMAHEAAHRLQVQERMVQQIADRMEQVTGSSNVAVLADGQHTCMTMRGVRTPGTMRTSVLRGVFRSQPDTRAEFLALANR